MRNWISLAFLFAILTLPACDGGGGSAASPPTFAVSVSVNGLAGALTLENNGGDTLSISANGTATFASPLAAGTPFHITVAQQPVGQTCTILNGTGSLTGSNVTNVVITCTNNTYSVGGTISGLNGNITLQLNGAHTRTFSGNGQFTYTGLVSQGETYSLTVLAQPLGQTCSVVNANGVINGADITDLAVNCTPNAYTVGFTVTGLSGSLVLKNNGANASTVSSNGAYRFSAPILNGEMYSVTVSTQPVGQNCTVVNGSGIVSAGNVTDVSISCAPKVYTVGGTVSGLTGSVLLRNNGAADIMLTGNGAFSFPQTVSHGAGYNVTVATQPTGQICTVGSGTGTATANVANVTVTCLTNVYTIGFTVTGLSGSLTLTNNGGNSVLVTNDGSFAFVNKVSHGGAYSVSVALQPTGQTCTVSNASGIATQNVSTVSVSCVTNTYSLGFTVTGLAGTLVIASDGVGTVSVSSNGNHTFTARLPHGAPYSVTVLTQPTGQTCTVGSGSGIATANITSVAVECIASQHSVGFTVTGLSGALIVSNGGVDAVSVTADGSYRLLRSYPYGSLYSIVIDTQPAGATCAVTNGAGVVTSDISNVAISCTKNAPTLTLVSLTPPSASLAKGTGQTLVATGSYSDGSSHSLSSVVWTSNTPGIATVSNQGEVSALAIGSTTITATADGISGSAMVTVTSAALQSLVVTPGNASIPDGSTQFLTATGYFTDGSYQAMPDVVWTSGSTDIATVSASGLLTALSAGTVFVTADYNGVVGTATITVTPALLTGLAISPNGAEIAKGTTWQLMATGTYSDGSTQPAPDASWTSSDTTIASVSNSGLVTGHKPGVVTVTAELSGASQSTTLTVTSAVLQSLSITPPGNNLVKGSSQILTATGHYSDGNAQIISEVAWTSNAVGVATVTSEGIVTGQSAGNAEISASAGGLNATASVTVTAPAEYMSIAPSQPTVSLGAAVVLSATANYANGTTQAMRNSVWTSSNTAVATISVFNGVAVVSGRTQGTSVISATESGLTGSVVIRVTPLAVKTIEIVSRPSPQAFNLQNIPKGLSIELALHVVYSDNTWKSFSSETDGVNWSVSNPTVLGIDATGMAEAITTGSTAITAQFGGLTTSTPVTVTVPAVSLKLFTRSFASAPYELLMNASHVTECTTLGSWAGTTSLYVSNFSGSGTKILTLDYLKGLPTAPYSQYTLTCTDSVGNEATASTPIIDYRTWSAP